MIISVQNSIICNMSGKSENGKKLKFGMFIFGISRGKKRSNGGDLVVANCPLVNTPAVFPP